MLKLPLIVGFGGINAAGRSSGFHSYKRLISEVLSENEIKDTWKDLANRMKIEVGNNPGKDIINFIKNGTLIRKIDSFDPDKVQINIKGFQNRSFEVDRLNLPKLIPSNWMIRDTGNQFVTVEVEGGLDIFVPVETKLGISCGANLPHGFDPANYYNAANHPLFVRISVYGASDAINSLGFSWETILEHISPDEVSVYAGSAFASIDEYSLGGLIKKPLLGGRVSSKMLALSLPEMPADFINSYIINSVGSTGANIGACASFLYNLRQGVIDIQTGRAQVVVVGSADAPLVPEVIEGFKSMKALATDAGLQSLDRRNEIDYRRACRPFSTNCGFTLGNASQFVVLMAPELALSIGANIYGSVADVFINADANKKSISAPGIGNYITFAKAVAFAKAIIGEEGLKKTFVQAHGTGTPQNRVTESHIMNEVAKTFGLTDWMVTAIKSYVGHSFGAAGGDQLIAALGALRCGWIAGIKTIDHIAADVHHSNLKILMDHAPICDSPMQAVFINSKGFGGNNATALILSPDKTGEILREKTTKTEWLSYQHKNEKIIEAAKDLDEQICSGKERVIYRFGESVMDEEDVKITQEEISLSKFKKSICFDFKNPYK